MGLHNSLATPGAVTMLGTPVDLDQLTTDAYVVAGIADHISPWQATYRSARLLGSKDLRFVLSSSGHIASLVNPPGNPKASFRLGSRGRAQIRSIGWSRPSSTRIRGGPTSCPGSPSAAASKKDAPSRSAARACRRSSPLPAPTCSNTEPSREACMTTVLAEPTDLLELVGQRLGTTDWMKITQDQVDRSPTRPGTTSGSTPTRSGRRRDRSGAPSRTATSRCRLRRAVISEVLQIRELTPR